ncbi:uncharacterized protein [Macrobrachium rosenbergii]|uniref:uncharacterized protein n=1 Tax=Macrobrachium rosenbergii TaxID=79674 RepID=UPI0034D5EDF3
MDEKLIELVRAYEELYDVSNRRYSDNIFKEKIWNRIGGELNKPGSECKLRWVSLRDQYRRYLRKVATKSGQESKTKYKYADEMSFVKPFLRERERASNQATDGASLDTEDVEDHAEEDDMESLQPKKQKCSFGGVDQPSIGEMFSGRVGKRAVKTTERTSSGKSKPPSQTASAVLMKYLLDNDKEKVSVDPTDLFFNTVAATVKKFSPYHQNIIKTKIFSLVSEYEMTQILEQNPHAASATPTPGYTTVLATVQNTIADSPYPSPSSYSHHSGENMDDQLQDT